MGHVHFQTLEGLLEIYFRYGSFLGLGEREMAVQNRGSKSESIHVF